MTDAKSAWHEAGERFSSLGGKLKLHYEQQRGQEADQAKAEVREALGKLTGALEDAFEAIGTAARDDAVKSDVKQVGQSLVTALGATFSQVSAEVQRQFTSRTGGSSGQSATGTPPPDGAEATTAPPSSEPPAAGSEPSAAGSEPSAAGSEPSAATEPPADGTSQAGAATVTEPATGPAEGENGPPKVEPWGTP
jgi:hypothetical protein